MRTVDPGPRRRWDERLGLPYGTVERAVHNNQTWIQVQQGQITPAQYWQDVARRLTLEPDAVQQLAVDFYAGDQLNSAVLKLIGQLLDSGHRIGLLSNDSPELRAKLDRLELVELFDPLVISAEIGVMKPKEGAYQAVLGKLGRPAEETIFIDDREENVNGARAVGMHAIHYIPDETDLADQLGQLAGAN